LSQVLIGLSKDYGRRTDGPPLPLWSNFLRVVPDGGLKKVDAARAARVSRRAMAAIMTGAEGCGLASIEQGAKRGGAVVTLTAVGRRARDHGRAKLLLTEAEWLSTLGEAAAGLGDVVRAQVRQLELELPYFPLGYGPVDDSMTGGGSRPGDPGPPRIPPHGQDWIPVVKEGGSTVEGVPLTALLSQILVAFAIDFEQANASLPTTVVWQAFPDSGVLASELPDGCPNPAGWERHGVATVHPTPLKKNSVIKLTAPARAARDRYLPRTAAIEEVWRHQFGDKHVATLREHLQTVVDAAELSHLPHFPRVSWVGGLRDAS
jgi:hypothetical protein